MPAIVLRVSKNTGRRFGLDDGFDYTSSSHGSWHRTRLFRNIQEVYNLHDLDANYYNGSGRS